MARPLKLQITVLLLLAGGLSARAEDLTTLDNKTYREVRGLQTNAFAIRQKLMVEALQKIAAHRKTGPQP